MGGQELERDQKESTDGGKRKLELADQKAQKIAAPLAAEAKRPRIAMPLDSQSNQKPVSNKKITIPEGKVGLVIGKGGETIKQIQLQSEAYVHIAKDHEADLQSLTRDVDLIGTAEQISRAEELINAVIFKVFFCPKQVPSTAQSNQNPVENKKITIPKSRVGLVVGKKGKTIKQIQLQSGAAVEVPRDHEADLHSPTRDVDVIGTTEQISRAEELINAVIFQEANAVSSTVQGFNVNQPQGKQFTVEVKVPNDKVGLLIGKGGETIKYMRSKSGANMKVHPLHLHPDDPSTERTLYINGTTKQIKAAKKLLNNVIYRTWISEPPMSSGYAQPAYAPAGNRAQPTDSQQLPQPTDISYYGQTQHQTAQMTGYGYYGQKPQMGSAPFGPSYGYSQQAPNYTENTTAQAEVQIPYGQPDGTVSSQSAEPASAYPPFWCSLGADPPASWQTESGYDPTVHWWEQTPQVPPLSTQATGEQAESQQPSKNGRSRSPATRPETRDESP